MNLGEWSVDIVDIPGMSVSEVYMWRLMPEYNREFITHEGLTKTFKEGQYPNQNEAYFTRLSNEQLQRFADALAKRGVRTVNDSKNAGLLEAKDEHLKDLQRLIFEGHVK